MHVLGLPPPCNPYRTPVGRHQEPGGDLIKRSQQFSPPRSERYSYPSPPMSDKQSPSHRIAQHVEQEHQHYLPPVTEPRTREAVPQPVDPRTTLAPSIPQQRALFPLEGQTTAPVHYQQGRAIDSSSFGGMQITQNYGFGYPGGVRSFLGGPGPGPQVQPTALPAPPPLRPSKPARRTKAHVASACVNCKKAHLSCDVQRPCGRCVASGKQDSCKDVQHKKRGRPRLRDHEDREFGRSEETRAATAHSIGPLPPTAPESAQHPIPPSRQQTDPLRLSRQSTIGSEGQPNVPQAFAQSSVLGRPVEVGSLGAVPQGHHPVGSSSAYGVLPMAFLNLDLVLLKANQPFQDLVTFLGDIRGKNLGDLLEPRQVEVLQRLRNDLRDEREQREPTYMAPITPLGQDPIQSVLERDVEMVSQGYTDRPHLLNFRLPNGQYQSLSTQIRLAKTSLYFVTLVVHTAPRTPGPTLLTSHFAPPSTIPVSQSYATPTAPPMREFGQHAPRPPSSASASTSAPTSPYFNFSAIRTSLPQGQTSGPSYGGSPSYGYSPTAGPEQSYFQTIQPMPQPTSYPSPYTPAVRPASVISDPIRRIEPPREAPGPGRIEGVQLPPIRGTPILPQPPSLAQGLGETPRDRVRRREPSPTGSEARPETPEAAGKRRRLNINEVLD